MRGSTPARTRAGGGRQKWEPGRESKIKDGRKNGWRGLRPREKFFLVSRVLPGAGACRGKIIRLVSKSG